MSSKRKTQHPQRASDDLPRCLVSPGDLWGKPLPFRPLYDAALPFDERVARAWEHIKTTRFTFEEHERLREVMAELLKEKPTVMDQLDE